MVRVDPSDVMFAGAGALWGIITMLRGVRAWQYRLTAAGVLVATGCICYLAWSFGLWKGATL